jgi:glycosyltransferase involved in cell wall biosynthesis
MIQNKVLKLAIIQSHPTQFDGTLFRKLASDVNIQLKVYFTSNNLNKSNYDPEINKVSGWDFDNLSGYESIYFPQGIISKILFSLKVLNKRENDLIVISGYSSWLYLLIAIIGKIKNVNLGLRADSVFLYRVNNLKWKLKDIILPIVYKLYSSAHPTSSLTKELMLSYGFKESAIFYFPYAIDDNFILSQYNKHLQNRFSLRNTFNISEDDVVLLGVIKFVDREDPLTLIKAYNDFVKSNNFKNKVHLVLVGDGVLMNQIQQFKIDNSLEYLHLPGYVNYSDLINYYILSDIFIHPAIDEPWGVSVNEAILCNVPVIVSDKVGAGVDLISNNFSGLVYKAGDFENLKLCLDKLIYDSNLRIKFSENALANLSDWGYSRTITETKRALLYYESMV